jgi:uncharacterized membrane protein
LDGSELNRTANVGVIRKLYRDGLLSDDAFIAANAVLRPVSSWFLWAERMLLFLGSTLVLAGIIFFFAYNWAVMGRFLKFGLIEAGIIVCILASYLRGTSRLSGKVLLLSASVLVGVLLAVHGQTYQTGADAFEMFIGWALLIFGWVIVSEFAALWLLWLVLLNVGVILYWHQVGRPADSIRYEFLCLAVAALNGAALALHELGRQRGFGWLSGRWLRSILLAASLVALSLPTIGLIVDFEDMVPVSVLAVFAWAVSVMGGYACYRFKLRDMVPLALIVMNLCVILLTLTAKVLFDTMGLSDSGVFLFFALVIVGVVSAAALWLRKTAATMAHEMKESGE